ERRGADDDFVWTAHRGALGESRRIAGVAAHELGQLLSAGQHQVAALQKGPHELDATIRSPQSVTTIWIDDPAPARAIQLREPGRVRRRTDQRAPAGHAHRARL